MGDQTILLEAGDSDCVPKGAHHTDRIVETLTATKTTLPGTP